MSDAIISAKQVSQKSGNTYLLKNINIEIYPGQHWIVFGNNGSGKTTLLNVLAGYLKPSSGELYFLNDLYSPNTIYQIYQNIGFVSSSFFDQCFSHETALEIVLSGITGMLSVPFDITAKDVRKAKHILKQFHLYDKMDFPYDLLSKGQRQCVLIGRALMSKPSLLILDEPTSGLDIVFRSKIISTIEALCASSVITILFVTHHANEISSCFENAMLIRDGEIFAFGKTINIFSDQVLSEYFNTPVKCSWKNDNVSIRMYNQPLDLSGIMY